MANVSKIVTGLTQLQKIVYINNPHKATADSDLGTVREIIRVAPNSLTSITLDGFTPNTNIKAIVPSADKKNTTHHLKEVTFTNMFASSKNDISYVSDLESLLGDKFKYSLIDLSKKEDVETYIRNMKKEGMNINYILVDKKASDVMCTALRKESVMLFDVC